MHHRSFMPALRRLALVIVIVVVGCRRFAHRAGDAGSGGATADAAVAHAAAIPFGPIVPLDVLEARVAAPALLRAGKVELGAPILQGGNFFFSDGTATRLVVSDVPANEKARPKARLLDRTGGKVLAAFFVDEDFALSSRAGVMVVHASAKGPAVLARLDTGAIHSPELMSPSGAHLEEPRYVMSEESPHIWVVAREPGEKDADVHGRHWAGVFEGSDATSIVLRAPLSYAPYDGVLDATSASGPTVTWLPIGGNPVPFGVDPSLLLQGDTLGDDCTLFSVDATGASTCRGTGRLPLDHQQRTDWLSGDYALFYASSTHVIVNTRVRAARPLHDPVRDFRTKYCAVLATYAQPPRVLEGCQNENGEGSATLWSPERVVTWNEPWFSVEKNKVRGFFQDGLEKEPIVHLADIFGKTAERKTHLFVDLESMRALRTKELAPLRVVFGSERPALAYARDGKELTLYRLDLEASELTPIAVYRDCPGMLQENDRSGSRVLIVCRVQPTPGLFVFQHVWSEVLDLEHGVRYRLPARGEALLPDGALVASDRRLDGAEALYAAHRIYLPRLGLE